MNQPFLRGLLADHELTLTDTDGRPLVEPTAALPSQRMCAYGDVRDGRPLNVPALQQVSRHWDALRDTVAAHAGAGTVADAFRASLSLTSAPLLWNRPEPLPASWSALYKACIGFSQVFCHLLLSSPGLASQPLSSVGTPADFFAWLQTGDWLLGQHQACAGSPAQIQELFAAFGDPRPQGPPLFGTEHADLALQAVALQAALVLATYRALQFGNPANPIGLRLLHNARWPWMHAVTDPPGREPAIVARLFPNGPPEPVQVFLRHSSADVFEELYWGLKSAPT